MIEILLTITCVAVVLVAIISTIDLVVNYVNKKRKLKNLAENQLYRLFKDRIDVIYDTIKEVLTESVDTNGIPTSIPKTYLDYLIKDIIREYVRTTVTEIVLEESERIEQSITAQIYQLNNTKKE